MGNNFSFDQLDTRSERLRSLSQLISEALNDNPKPIVLFGSGYMGKAYLEYLRKMELEMELYFCDNDSSRSGTYVEGILVISFDELKEKYSDSYILISVIDCFDEIFNKLKKHHFGGILLSGEDFRSIFYDRSHTFETYQDYDIVVKENLRLFEHAYHLMSDELSKKIFVERISYLITGKAKHLIPLKSRTPHYFDPDIIKLSDEETFIDGGAFTGDTVEEFLRQTEGKFKQIYAFEPEVSKQDAFLSVIGDYGNIELLPFGLWDKRDVLRFSASNDAASSLDQNGDIEIHVISIDEVLNGNSVTFIKMDIEGAEVEALKGAEKSIRKYKPKLAISAYHKQLDLVEIPMYLKELVPEYSFYLRHYGHGATETVLYAVIE